MAKAPDTKAAAMGADPHLAHLFRTEEESAERGRAARKEVPRSTQGQLDLPADRRDPVDVLREQDMTRLHGLVPLRYGRMLVSPFTFYRGAAAIMAGDLAPSPTSGVRVQACGDAHLSNFGAFESPERQLLFDINDFDETLPAPWEWDVKRLAASLEIAGRDRGFSKADRQVVVQGCVREYRSLMRSLADRGNLEIWYSRVDMEAVRNNWVSSVSPEQAARFAKGVAKAQGKNNLRAFSKLVEEVDGKLRIINDPPALQRIVDLVSPDQAPDVHERIQAIISKYRESLGPDRRVLLDRYTYVDAAVKVVGVGSVGTRAWIILMMGRDSSDPLFLQLKEAQQSVMEPYAGKSRYRQHGRRVVEGQRLTQAASDIMLGWVTAEGLDGVDRDFYVRQLWDGKASANVDKMDPSVLAIYGQLCGYTLARAHARTGDRIAIASYLGKGEGFDKAMVRFADAYADLNQKDYERVREAADSGEIPYQPSDR